MKIPTFILTIILTLIACQNKSNQILQQYENFLKELEAKQIKHKNINIDSVNKKRNEILLQLEKEKLNANQIEWLKALNARFSILITNERNKFPTDTIPDFIAKSLKVSNKITSITPKNLPEQYDKLLSLTRQNKMHKDSLLKIYKFLEKYKTLYNDELTDSSIFKIEKLMIEIEKNLQ